MVHYRHDLDGITSSMLEGFCVGWRSPLSGERLLEVLSGSSKVVLAMKDDRVVGFVNALSDGSLMAFIPLLEVRPEYQKQGIGQTLIQRMIADLAGHYGIDLLCDAELVPYYERFGMTRVNGMCLRDFEALASSVPTK